MTIPVSLEAKAKVSRTLVLLYAISIAGCGPPQSTYADSPEAPNSAQIESRSDSVARTSKRRVVLTGSAAIYYMYSKHLGASGTGVAGKYYRSSRGEVYYRDRGGRHCRVVAPAGGIQLAAEEAARVEKEARQAGFW